MRPILVFQHLPCEGPGRFLDYAQHFGLGLEVVNFMEGGVLPSGRDYPALIVLGGSMNVYQEEEYPWLGPETRFITEWVQSGRPYLGICLGGQLLAKAIGGKVTRNARKEIGNFNVELTTAGRTDPLLAGFPSTFPMFQWHGDTFSDLGEGECLAASAWCAHQAFRYGALAYGLQFHIEINQAMARDWLHEFNPELVEEKLDPEAIYASFAEQEPQYARLSELLFTNFVRLAGII